MFESILNQFPRIYVFLFIRLLGIVIIFQCLYNESFNTLTCKLRKEDLEKVLVVSKSSEKKTLFT